MMNPTNRDTSVFSSQVARLALNAAVALLVGAASGTARGEQARAPLPAAEPEVLAAYRLRVEHVRRQVPTITRCAESVARRWAERRHVLLHLPFGGDTSDFSMELISRAGGLDNAQPNTLRVKLRTTNDVIVVAPRSWERGSAFLRKELPRARSNNWSIIAFGSREGMPAGLPADWLIDNGARGGGEDEAALNHIVNITQGWIWCAELTAALTRLGWRPAVLQAMPVPGAVAHNRQVQHTDGLPELFPWSEPIPAGQLAGSYLEEIDRQIAALDSPSNRTLIARAAAIATEHVRAGKTIWASSMTHTLDGEVFLDNRSPIRAFRGISCGKDGETFTRNMRPGDLLFFFGEWTLNLPWRDYLRIIRSTGADYIPSFRRGSEPTEAYEGQETYYDCDVSDAPLVLEQHWPFEGGVVPIPFAPGRMAPVSGVHVCLLYRMLDEEIARQVNRLEPGGLVGPPL